MKLSDRVPPFNQQGHHNTALFIRPVLCNTNHYIWILLAFYNLTMECFAQWKQTKSINIKVQTFSSTSFRRKIPPYVLTGSRSEQILHPILRLNCNLLNAHLHSRRIVKSPNCLCGSTEITEHYFIHFPINSNRRTKCLSTT